MSHIIDHLSVGICVAVTKGPLRDNWGYVQTVDNISRVARVRFVDGIATADVLIHYQYLQIVDME
jgi:hypothetical protein